MGEHTHSKRCAKEIVVGVFCQVGHLSKSNPSSRLPITPAIGGIELAFPLAKTTSFSEF